MGTSRYKWVTSCWFRVMVLVPPSTIFQLYCEKTTNLPQVIDKLYHIKLYWVHLIMSRILTTLGVIGTDFTGSCKPNYHDSPKNSLLFKQYVYFSNMDKIRTLSELFNAKWANFQLHCISWREQVAFWWIRWCPLWIRPKHLVDFYSGWAHLDNSLQIDMLLCSDTLSWFRANQSALTPKYCVFSGETLPIFSMVWHLRTQEPRTTSNKMSVKNNLYIPKILPPFKYPNSPSRGSISFT